MNTINIRTACFAFLFISGLTVAGPGRPALSAQEGAAPPPEAAARPPAPRLKRPAAARPALRKRSPRIDHRKEAALLYGIMERLETLSALYENHGLRVSTGTLKKAYALDRAVNTAADAYFRPPGPKPDREAVKTYRGLVDTALRGVKVLKELRTRMKPADTEPAMNAVRELYLAIEDELTGRALIFVSAEPKRDGKAGEAAGGKHETGEALANETETLVTVSELAFALSAYRKDTGTFPKHLKDLVPQYIPAIPAIAIAGHPSTAEVNEIDFSDYDSDLSRAVKDTGRWLYFTNKKSVHYGKVMVDCSHKTGQGVEFHKVGEVKW